MNTAVSPSSEVHTGMTRHFITRFCVVKGKSEHCREDMSDRKTSTYKHERKEMRFGAFMCYLVVARVSFNVHIFSRHAIEHFG